MKILIKDIHPEGLEVTGVIPLDVIGLTPQDAVYFSAPLEAAAKVSRTGNTVLAKTRVRGRQKSFCSRCLKDVEQDWEEEFFFDFTVDRSTESIELGDDIRQEVILNLPPRMLCRPDCQGICPNCGVDLNTEVCQCKGEK